MHGGTRSRRPTDPSRAHELIAHGLLALSALALLTPVLVLVIGQLSPREFDAASPWQGLAVIVYAALSAIPAGLVAVVGALISRRLGAGAIAYGVAIFGLLLAAAPFIWFAIRSR